MVVSLVLGLWFSRRHRLLGRRARLVQHRSHLDLGGAIEPYNGHLILYLAAGLRGDPERFRRGVPCISPARPWARCCSPPGLFFVFSQAPDRGAWPRLRRRWCCCSTASDAKHGSRATASRCSRPWRRVLGHSSHSSAKIEPAISPPACCSAWRRHLFGGARFVAASPASDPVRQGPLAPRVGFPAARLPLRRLASVVPDPGGDHHERRPPLQPAAGPELGAQLACERGRSSPSRDWTTTTDAPSSACVGPALAVIALAALGWRLRRGNIPEWLWAAMAVPATLWVIGARWIACRASCADDSRYIFAGTLAVLLVAAEAARGVRIGRDGMLVLYAPRGDRPVHEHLPPARRRKLSRSQALFIRGDLTCRRSR